MNNVNYIIRVEQLDKNLAHIVLLENINGKYNIILEDRGYIGKNGITDKKVEGDLKTPIGKFNIGFCFTMHDRIQSKIDYIKINENLYLVDDVNSKYYNKLVDITKVDKDWNSAEHLIDYPLQYEYGFEIKTNPENIPNKGSAIFFHCESGNPTAGCVSVKRETMIEILKLIDESTIIEIKK